MNSRRVRFFLPATLVPTIVLPVLSARPAQAQQKVVRGHLRVDTPVVNSKPGATSTPGTEPGTTPAPSTVPTPNAAPLPNTPPAPSVAPVPSAAPAPSAAPSSDTTLPVVNTPDAQAIPAPRVVPSPDGIGQTGNGQTPPPPPATPPAPPAATSTTPTDPSLESGQEAVSGNGSLSAPGGVVYDGERGLAVAQGNVTFTYGEFQVSGDRGVINYNTNKATLSGNLMVTVRGRTLRGQSLTFDISTGQWTLSQLTTTFEPEFFTPGTVLEPIYVFGSQVQGVDNQITGNNFTISSCDRGHYYLKAGRLDFYRDQNGQLSKIALRKSALYLFGHKILPLPAYVISLTGQRSRRIGLQPTVGQNEVDGFFAKTTFDLAANNRYTDTLLVDLLQKRGVGLGLVREFAGAAGLLSLYAVSGRAGQGRQIDAKVQRLFNFSKEIQGVLNVQNTQNNSTTGLGNSNLNGDFTVNRVTPRAQSNVIFNIANSSGSGFKTGNNSISATHNQQLGSGFSLNANSIFTTNTSTGTDASRQLQNRFGLNYGGKSFDALARLELYNDLTHTSGSSINQLSRLPEVAFTSNTDRLKLPFLSRFVPGEFTLGLGDFAEPRFGGASGSGSDTTRNSRTDFGYTMRPRQIPLLKRGSAESTLTVLGRFQQDFYSDSSAKYDYSYGFGLNNRFGPFSAQINYAKLRELGSTPFAFDFLTPSEAIDATLAFQPSQRFRFNLSAGRDLQNGISYDIVARLQAQPLRNFYTSLSTNYSPSTSRLGDIIGNFQLQRKPSSFLGGTFDLGLRYSSQQSMLAQATAQASFTITRKTQIEALGSYNGFTKQFDTYQFRVTQDLHCFNLYATYDSFRKQFRLDLALKAFPYFDTRYGVGPAGQGFSSIIGGTQ